MFQTAEDLLLCLLPGPFQRLVEGRLHLRPVLLLRLPPVPDSSPLYRRVRLQRLVWDLHWLSGRQSG